MSGKYKYRVCGWRWRHVMWPAWSMGHPPKWLVAFFKREPKEAKKYWTLERVYRREE